VAVENLPALRRQPAAGRWQDATNRENNHLPIALD